MSERVFTVQGQLPIPVGHAVELLFVGVRTGLFSSALTKDEYKPLVRDLVTGVVYGRQFHFTTDDALPPPRSLSRHAPTSPSSSASPAASEPRASSGGSFRIMGPGIG